MKFICSESVSCDCVLLNFYHLVTESRRKQKLEAKSGMETIENLQVFQSSNRIELRTSSRVGD